MEAREAISKSKRQRMSRQKKGLITWAEDSEPLIKLRFTKRRVSAR
jgi:hypothetical protein